MDLDILIEDPQWNALDLEPLVQDATRVTLAHQTVPEDRVEVSLLACNDARITCLNGEFRSKPAPTNVLSWPTENLSTGTPGAVPEKPEPDLDGSLPLGDIAIAYETCAREAVDLGKPMPEHVTHLIVHGLLHLLGYDHENDADAALMHRIEAEILGKLGIDDPY